MPVRIVPLFPESSNKVLRRALRAERVRRAVGVQAQRAQACAAGGREQPWALLSLGVVLVLLLAGNERWNARLVVEPA